MKNNSAVVFPGSFDPLTNGHLDIIKRSLTIFDRIIIAVLVNPNKQSLFTADERVALIKQAFSKEKSSVKVCKFSGLLVDFMKAQKARVIIRGLRAVSDYEYELQMALMNRHLSKNVETVFLTSSEQHSYISSTIVKQASMIGGDVRALVPKAVLKAMQQKFAESRK